MQLLIISGTDMSFDIPEVYINLIISTLKF